MIPVLVTIASKPISSATARPWVRTETDRSQRARRRTGLLEPGHRLDVVVEDVGLGLDHGADVVLGRPLRSLMRTSMLVPGFSRRIWRIVSATIRAPPSGRSSRATMVTTTCLRPIWLRRLGDAPRLVPVGDRRAAGVDGAEAAVPRADAAEDHEGRRAERPALADVRAARLLADGVERLVAKDVLRVRVGASGTDADLQPLGPPPTRTGILGNRVARGEQAAIGLRAAGIHHLRRGCVAA